MSRNVIVFITLLLFPSISIAQVQKDLANSVPLWMDTDSTTGEAVIRWLHDENASRYEVFEIKFKPFILTLSLGETDGNVDSLNIGQVEKGIAKNYYVRKTGSITGTGFLHGGLELPIVQNRGKCLIAVAETIVSALGAELAQYETNLIMDGWAVHRFEVKDSMDVPDVKSAILDWYDPDYERSQSVFILGHVPVPYSGNTAYDGHTNHYGAWSADSYYAETDGNWTDFTVDETSPSRPENDNIPGDGKFDQSTIPGEVEIEVGRVDFYNLPALGYGEIELTRQYLEKNHRFKMGERQLQRRAIVENNFPSFDEAFGQSAWRNFPTFFKGDQVTSGNYDTQLDTSAYLCSYACGGGSYTSCGGIGTTANLWAAKDLQTVFTMVFGSYFGDWDSKDNFLRAALASGDILTNAWSGRPIWQLWHMGLGLHIGYSTKYTMNASSAIFNAGYGTHSAHIGLMGDPTLRLFYPKPVESLSADYTDGNIQLSWPETAETNVYVVYRKNDSGDWEDLTGMLSSNSYVDSCAIPGNYAYMVKSVRLEETGSGSFYNTSLGVIETIQVDENDQLTVFFRDQDGDGYGNAEIDTTACSLPYGFSMNDLDCDDSNAGINPDAIDIPDNGIDEDCDGNDLVNTYDQDIIEAFIFPNPAVDHIIVQSTDFSTQIVQISNMTGQIVRTGLINKMIDLSGLQAGTYLVSTRTDKGTVLHAPGLLIIIE
jgi:hypothetical protein